MAKAHNYQQDREESNPNVSWHVIATSEGNGRLDVSALPIETLMDKDTDGYYEGMRVGDPLVEDTFKFKNNR